MSLYQQNQILNDSSTTNHIITTLTSNQNMIVDGSGNITTSATPIGGVTSVTGTAPIVSSGGSTPAISLANTGVTAGSYTNSNITVNAQGLITSAASNTVSPTQGGTGITTYTTGDTLYASASNTLAKLSAVATGNALISGGVSTAPSWGKIGLTTHVSGTLPAANGGTGTASYTVGDILYADTTTTLAKLPDVAAGSFLRAGGVGVAPSWSTLTIPNTVSANRILVTNSNAIVTSNAPTNGQIMIGSSGAGFTLNTITAGSNITVTNAAASITVAAPAVVKTAFTVGTTTGALTNGTSTFPVGYTIPANTFATNGDTLEFYYTFGYVINSGAPVILYEFGPSSGSSPFALITVGNSGTAGSGFLRVVMIRTSTTEVTMRFELLISDTSMNYTCSNLVTYTGGFSAASAATVGLKFSNTSAGASSAQITTYGSRVQSMIQ